MATKTKGKKPKQQITVRQRRLADAVIENAKSDKPLSRTELLRVAGYSPSTSGAGTRLAFNSQGLAAALAERGITPNTITQVLQDASLAKQGAWFKGEYIEDDAADHAIRLRAADQLADLTGMKVTKVQVQSVNVTLDSADLAAMLGIS